MDGFLQGLIDRELTPCASLEVIRGGRSVYSFAAGCSDLPQRGGAPIDGHTRFNIGSVTKPVTASLILKLCEMGKLTLEDPVRRHIPAYPFGDVTLLHLMTHTAGYGPDVDRGIPWPRSPAERAEYFDAIYAVTTRSNPPGEVEQYCTQGYSVLMDVLERVTGCTIEAFAREHLFDPLGMDHTTYDVGTLDPAHIAHPWRRQDPAFFSPWYGAPATGDSGLNSTARDMVRFAGLFLAGGAAGDKRIFSRAATARMLRETTGGRHGKTPVFWHRGFNNLKGSFGDLNSFDAVGHAGFSGTWLLIDPAWDLAFMFITNSSDIHDDYAIFRVLSNLVMAQFV